MENIIMDKMATDEELLDIMYQLGVQKVYEDQRKEYFRPRYKINEYCETLPIDENLIYFTSQHGSNISGNIFYILRYIASSEKYSRFKICVCVTASMIEKFNAILRNFDIQNVELVTLSSERYFKVISTAKYLVIDNTLKHWWRKRPEQILINTWHGTPLKTLGRFVESNIHEIGNAQKIFCDTDYFIFPNEHTRDVILKDYMVEHLTNASYLMAGYPRITPLFDEEGRNRLRKQFGFEKKKVYAYMPTFRGSITEGLSVKGESLLQAYLYQIDRFIRDDEEFYVNLHPISKSAIKFNEFKRIKEFPKNLETYEFLNACDCLVTDYSSIFFDYAITGRKIVLFPFDKELYLRDRGVYMDMGSLPFPICYSLEQVLSELRSPKQYDDREFLKKFSAYEDPKITEKICDQLILNENCNLEVRKPLDNGLKNVFLYVGRLDDKEVSAKVIDFLKKLDVTKYNYTVVVPSISAEMYPDYVKQIPKTMGFFIMLDFVNRSYDEAMEYQGFLYGKVPVREYMAHQYDVLHKEYEKVFGRAKVDAFAVLANDYSDICLTLTAIGCKGVFYEGDELLAKKNGVGYPDADITNYLKEKIEVEMNELAAGTLENSLATILND